LFVSLQLLFIHIDLRELIVFVFLFNNLRGFVITKLKEVSFSHPLWEEKEKKDCAYAKFSLHDTTCSWSIYVIKILNNIINKNNSN